MDLRHWISSPWTGLLAFVTITPTATVPLGIATLANPAPGRAIRPNAPPPPREVQVPVHVTYPVVFLWLPLPMVFDQPLCATMAPLCEAPVRRKTRRASPAIPLDPFVSVRLPRAFRVIGIRKPWSSDLGARLHGQDLGLDLRTRCTRSCGR